ncbi:MAG: sigma-54 dependent transcriptional regulator [Burkholderiales bacterium]|nr:sigma-54 dependent transcriptional regulator [Burkholderiales bacterium]
MSSNQILVVDDEVGIRDLLSEILWDEGYQVTLAENANQARLFRNKNRPDLVLLDIWMPDTDGITLLKEWANSGLLTMPVVMMSGHGTIDTAVEATRIGACDFLEKPIALQKLLSTVGRALQHNESSSPSTPISLSALGKSNAVLELKKTLEHAKKLKLPVFLTGEPGCEIDICAQFFRNTNFPWIDLEDSAELSSGHTDLLKKAKEGILFIREIGDLKKEEQKGLLSLLCKLENHNIKLICASTQPLAKLVALGDYDADLFQTLMSLTVVIPPLRTHAEDIPNLANLILSRYVEAKETPIKQFNTASLNALRNYDWPGNLAQLMAVVKSLALTALGEEITLENTNQILSKQEKTNEYKSISFSLDLPLREARDIFEKMYFEYHLSKETGGITKVADNVGLERTHLYRKLKQLGIKFKKN